MWIVSEFAGGRARFIRIWEGKMYLNPKFQEPDPKRNLDFVRERGFGVLSVSGIDGPIAVHLPFILSADGKRLEAHVMRSNPVWRAIEEPTKALMVVSGPDGYISPDWYGDTDAVPTWNYVAVHLRGVLRRVDPGEIHAYVERLSDTMEARLAPKPIWKSSKMASGALERLYRMIVPLEMDIESVEGIRKLNQNKPADQAMAAADRLEEGGFGQDIGALVAMMREANATR